MSNRRWRRPVRYSLGRRSKQHDLITGVAVLGCVFLAVGAAVGIGAATSGGSGRRSAAATISTPNSFTTSTTMTVTQVADQNETQTWSAEISKDFADLDSVLEPLLQSTESWERGSAVSRSTGPPATGSAVAAEIAGYWPDFSDTRGALAKQAPLALARQALNDYQMSVDLYVESVRLVLLTTHLPAGPLQHQLQLSSTRIRELGDRVYDQATAVLAPFTAPTAPTPDVTIVAPPDVPLWASIGLAAGPPLDSTSPTLKPISYQVTRPQESFAKWKEATEQVGIPSVTAEVNAIEDGSLPVLRNESDKFSNAVSGLTAQPDPADGRIAGTRLRLGLLVDAEATRAAEAGALLAAAQQRAQITDIAETLALIGDELWDPKLGHRVTNFPSSLLTNYSLLPS